MTREGFMMRKEICKTGGQRRMEKNSRRKQHTSPDTIQCTFPLTRCTSTAISPTVKTSLTREELKLHSPHFKWHRKKIRSPPRLMDSLLSNASSSTMHKSGAATHEQMHCECKY